MCLVVWHHGIIIFSCSKTKRLREAIVKETRRRRRYTELLSVRRKSVVKSSEVGFTNSVDVELSQM